MLIVSSVRLIVASATRNNLVMVPGRGPGSRLMPILGVVEEGDATRFLLGWTMSAVSALAHESGDGGNGTGDARGEEADGTLPRASLTSANWMWTTMEALQAQGAVLLFARTHLGLLSSSHHHFHWDVSGMFR